MTEPNEQTKPGRFRQFLSDWWGWIVVAIILLVLIGVPVVLVWTGRLPTGFGDYTDPTGEFQRGKTLWDWMDLLLAPAVIGIFGALFSWVLGRRQHEAQEQRTKEQHEAEERRARAEQAITLESLERMGTLSQRRDQLLHAG